MEFRKPDQTTESAQKVGSDHLTHHRDDLRGREAVNKIREFVEKVDTCFFVTAVREDGSSGARPMAVREVDDAGNFWFLSAKDTHKDHEVQVDAEVRLYFQDAEHADFLEVTGRATVSQDRARIKQLWEPGLKNWFTEGENDPRISVIKVTPEDGYYWDTRDRDLASGIRMFIAGFLQEPLRDKSQSGSLHL